MRMTPDHGSYRVGSGLADKVSCDFLNHPVHKQFKSYHLTSRATFFKGWIIGRLVIIDEDVASHSVNSPLMQSNLHRLVRGPPWRPPCIPMWRAFPHTRMRISHASQCVLKSYEEATYTPFGCSSGVPIHGMTSAAKWSRI